MNYSIKEGMYIISTSCYRCEKPMNVAVIQRKGGHCGPEAFSEEEKRIAENHNVTIRDQYSGTRREYYDANTCPNCNTFVGQHYLFTDYLTSAIYGGEAYKIIDLN